MKEIQGQRMLVTGADGFIGSHLVERLVERGAAVRAFTYYNSFNSAGWIDTLPPAVRSEVEIISGDVRDSAAVRMALKDIDAVFHLAALIGIPFSYRAPDSYVDTNIKGTLNVLQAARDLDTETVIHTSTSEVYGTAQFVPITEEHPLEAQSPYAATKIGADQLALSFFRSFATPVAIVRPFNTYGPRQSMRAVIPTIITQLARGRRELRIGSLSPTRDFTYVQDTVDGFIAAAEHRPLGEVIQLGSNFEISIGDTARLISELLDREVKICTEPERIRPEQSEVERLWADNRKAMHLLQWQPRFAGREGFQRGLMQTVQWFQDPENLKQYRDVGYAI